MSCALITLIFAWMACVWLCGEVSARRQGWDWRRVLALGTVAWGALLVGVVETLSALRCLNRPACILAWATVDCALVAPAWILARRRNPHRLKTAWAHLKDVRTILEQWPASAKALWLGVLLIAAFLLGVAATTPTTNLDSLSYHLPRVLHWIQQQSVQHFPTDNPRQIEFAPWPAFVQTQLFLLAGSDSWMNLPQWVAMVLSVLLLTLLLEDLGKWCGVPWCLEDSPEAREKRRMAGALTALLAATIPMGMMQSITPQTDYLTAFWTLLLFMFVLRIFLEPRSWSYAAGAGLACGLAVLSKSTAIIYAAPLVLGSSLWLLFRRDTWGVKLRTAALFAGLVLLLNLPHGMRNFNLFGSAIGSQAMERIVRNQRITPRTFASNLIRNLALHDNCGIPLLTQNLNRLAVRLHALTGERMNDPATLVGPAKLFDQFVVTDDFASAPWHVLWIALAALLALWRPRRRLKLLCWAGFVLASFGLFVLLLKFQLWHTRFHLVYLLLLMPVVTLVCFGDGFQILFTCQPQGQIMNRSHWCAWQKLALTVIPGSSFLYACICLSVNQSRPIFNAHFASLPREQQYLAIYGPDWNKALADISAEILAGGGEKVGLKIGFGGFEYPIWVWLRNRGFTGRIDHCYVENVSALLPTGGPESDVIIANDCEPPPEVVKHYPYRTLHPPLMVLWAKKPVPANTEL